ncbi:hypothetical protein SAMN04489732_13060 [Amycolatopsis saalfeldensis]|uniref:Uncharacterized protein n=2 Tax=Amycolatopsis saalfeldensis TaxID=394193 RepID=A0A1H8YQX5_9PSEU|nr:hypothetical protein SAMN04489732_13060 [Amycolatopsis saalfeldensis]
MPHREFPCGPCPIRADNCDNPKAKFPAERWTALRSTVRDPETGKQPFPGDPMFGCHKGEPGTNDDLSCAGWLVQFGSDHIGVRLAVATGRLPESALEAGDNWPPLHETWEDVVRHQTAPAAGPSSVMLGPDGEDTRWEPVAQAVWDWHDKARPWSAATAAARRDYRAGSLRALAVIDAGDVTRTDLAAVVVQAAFSLPSATWRKMRPRQRQHLLAVGRVVIEAATSALPAHVRLPMAADVQSLKHEPGAKGVSR